MHGIWTFCIENTRVNHIALPKLWKSFSEHGWDKHRESNLKTDNTERVLNFDLTPHATVDGRLLDIWKLNGATCLFHSGSKRGLKKPVVRRRSILQIVCVVKWMWKNYSSAFLNCLLNAEWVWLQSQAVLIPCLWVELLCIMTALKPLTEELSKFYSNICDMEAPLRYRLVPIWPSQRSSIEGRVNEGVPWRKWIQYVSRFPRWCEWSGFSKSWSTLFNLHQGKGHENKSHSPNHPFVILRQVVDSCPPVYQKRRVF